MIEYAKKGERVSDFGVRKRKLKSSAQWELDEGECPRHFPKPRAWPKEITRFLRHRAFVPLAMASIRVIIACVLALCVASAVAMQCKDETGKPVDWWYVPLLQPLFASFPPQYRFIDPLATLNSIPIGAISNMLFYRFIHKLPLLGKSPISPDGFGYYYADPNHPHYVRSRFQCILWRSVYRKTWG